MRALITGANGQLGRALRATAPGDAEVIAHDHAGMDVTDRAAVLNAVTAFRPDFVLNAAGYTAVDRAEREPDAARAVNATATGYLAEAAAAVGARLVHVSTDFVFDGRSGCPYLPDAPAQPLSVYGVTKREGERLAGPDALIVRTAWVYSAVGGNFVTTMLRLMRERPEVRVVDDQIGTPTYAPALAAALWTLARHGLRGTFHYTDAGTASWYDFAVAIQEEALAAGLLDHAVPIVPVGTADYPTAAQRPHSSVLDKRSTYAALGAEPTHWRVNLRRMIAEVSDLYDRSTLVGATGFEPATPTPPV